MTEQLSARLRYERDLMAREKINFARHQIHMRGDNGRDWTIMEPHAEFGWCNNLWAEILVGASGTLIVHGDIESCIFANFSGGSPAATVAWIGAHRDIHYVASKAALGFGEDHRERNAEVFLAELREHYDEWEERHGRPMSEEEREHFDDAFDEFDEGDDVHQLEHITRELMDNGVIDSEVASSLGYVITQRVIRAHAAVARLHELLTSGAEDEFNASDATYRPPSPEERLAHSLWLVSAMPMGKRAVFSVEFFRTDLQVFSVDGEVMRFDNPCAEAFFVPGCVWRKVDRWGRLVPR